MKLALIVYYDEESMQLANVEFGKEFEGETALFRADVLSDTLEYVVATYNETIADMDEEHMHDFVMGV
jgi:hypothetical protein